MSITLHYASGSPYAWRVWLALEHKQLPYRLATLSFSAGDLKKPAFLALNPRHKVPVLQDDDFAIYESAAILDYLEEAYPARPLLPRDVRARATARRMIREIDEYLARALEVLVDEILFTPTEKHDAARIERGRDAFTDELAVFEDMLPGDWFAGDAGAVDYALYPIVALALRMQLRVPSLGIDRALGPKLTAWQARFEALPVFAATYPPHWKQ
jgi:glutathione S-transferase